MDIALQVPLHGPRSSDDDGDDVNWFVPIRVLDVILQILVLSDFFHLLSCKPVVIWRTNIDDSASFGAFIQNYNIGPDCTISDVSCCRDQRVLVLHKWLGLVLPGYIVSVKPVLLAEPPMDDPANIVMPCRIPSFCQHFGAAGEEMGDGFDTFLAEPTLVIIGELEYLLEPIRVEAIVLSCKNYSFAVKVENTSF